jgi:hypothetical protein
MYMIDMGRNFPLSLPGQQLAAELEKQPAVLQHLPCLKMQF